MVAQLARAASRRDAMASSSRSNNDPDRALSDGAQSMFPAQFERLMAELRINRAGDWPQHLSRARGSPRLGSLENHKSQIPMT